MITWDASKRRSNLRKHGIDLADCEQVFDGIVLTREDRSEAYGEQRMQSIGVLAGHVVFMVWTERSDGAHVNSWRKANRDERKRYHEALGH